MRMFVLVLGFVGIVLGASESVAGRRARWTGTLTDGGLTATVTIKGRLEPDCRALQGRWKCRGLACPRRRARLLMSCDTGRLFDGAITWGSQYCAILGPRCAAGVLRDTWHLTILCDSGLSAAALTRQPTKRMPTCTR